MADAFASFVASGRIADLVLAVLALEAVALAALRLSGRGGVPLPDLLWFTASGVFLVLALRAALTGAGWWWIGIALTGAFLSHLMDLRRRWSPPGG